MTSHILPRITSVYRALFEGYMQFKDGIEANGELEIILRGPDGKVKDHRVIPNLIVTSGKNWLAARAVSAGTPVAMSHMAVGTGAVAPAPGDTTLGTEIAGSRTALASQTATNNTFVFSCTFAAGSGTGAITEAGIFNAAAAGTMLNRATFPVVNKGASDAMQINWTVTQN